MPAKLKQFVQYLLLAFCLALILPAHSQEPCSKIPAGWTLEAQKSSGDFCADVLLKADEDGTRKLRVFAAGTLGFASDEVVLCKSCGGTMGDPFQGMEWKGETLLVSNSGGSRWLDEDSWKFALRNQRWVIIGWDRQTVDRLALSAWQESVNTITGKANARYTPGELACEAAGSDEDIAKCRKGDKMKAKNLSCSYPAKLPGVETISHWREQAFACGLQPP